MLEDRARKEREEKERLKRWEDRERKRWEEFWRRKMEEGPRYAMADFPDGSTSGEGSSAVEQPVEKGEGPQQRHEHGDCPCGEYHDGYPCPMCDQFHDVSLCCCGKPVWDPKTGVHAHANR